MDQAYLVALAAVGLCAAWVAFVNVANRKIHPAVLFRLFLVELWERFSYYGMRAFLILYLTKGLVLGGFGIPEKLAYGIYGAYGAIVYLTPILGGLLADRYLGFRKAIVWGALLMAAGQFTLAASSFVQTPDPVAWAAEKKAKKDKAEAEKKQASDSSSALDSSIKPATDVVKPAAAEGDAAKSETSAAAASEGPKASPTRLFLLFLGLSLLTIGNGFFKPNISSMIGKFYAPGDPRRDGAFTIFYMGINIGAFVAPLVCGTLAEDQGWYFGFLLAGIGMLVGLGLFLWTSAQGFLEDKADAPPAPEGGHKFFGFPADPAIYLGTFLLVPIACGLMYANDIMDILLGFIGVGMVSYMVYLSTKYDQVPKERIWTIIVLLLFTTVFWTFFELAGSAINVFTDKNVSKKLVGLTFETSNFQALNALFIMIFAPIFSAMWIGLANAKKEPAAPLKFSAGLLMLGLGFLVLNVGRPMSQGGIMPAEFLVVLYLLHTLGELAISPVGLSLVTKLAPERIVGFMMGFWFLSSSIAHQAGKLISQAMAVDGKAPAEVTLGLSLGVFNNVGLFAVGSAVVLLLLSPIVTKWMHGIK